MVTFNIPGAYQLTFSGKTNIMGFHSTSILVKKNGELNFYISDNNEAELAVGNNLSYVWIMELEQGNTIQLFSDDLLYAGDLWPLTFTAQLIQKH